MTASRFTFYTFAREVRNSITCFYLGHGRHCQCGFASETAKAPRTESAAAPPTAPSAAPTGQPASPISVGDDGQPRIPLRLATRYFMLLWTAILRGAAPFPEARKVMAETLDAYSRFYPGPFATGS